MRWNFARFLLAAGTTPVVSAVVIWKLSPDLQGYYYTFNSLLTLQVFLELGFSLCITQFISHEFALLTIKVDGRIEGPPLAQRRFVGIGKLALRWYLLLGVALTAVLIVVGECFFHGSPSDIAWRGPWWLLSLSSGIGVCYDALIAIENGMNRVSHTAKLAIWRNLIRLPIIVGLLILGADLYSIALAVLCSNVVVLIAAFVARKTIFYKMLLSHSDTHVVSWVAEIWPMQWRIGLSWISGFFIFSLFNPIIFKYIGPVAAGRFGMTWTAINGIVSLCQVPMNTRQPMWGILLAREDHRTLWSAWRRVLVFCLILALLAAGCSILVLHELTLWPGVSRRLLSVREATPLIAAGVFNQFSFSVAAVTRAEKREPFLYNSLCSALFISVGLVFATPRYGLDGVAWVFFLASLFNFPWAWWIMTESKAYRHRKDSRTVA